MLATCTALVGRLGEASSGSSTSAASPSMASVAAEPTSVKAAPAAPKPRKAAPAPVEVTALKLWNAYDANEVAADNAYKGQSLLVTGSVASIDKDMFDNVVLHLKSPNEFMNTQATLEDSEKSIAASLAKGSKVALLCTGGGRIIGTPMLSDCTIK